MSVPGIVAVVLGTGVVVGGGVYAYIKRDDINNFI